MNCPRNYPTKQTHVRMLARAEVERISNCVDTDGGTIVLGILDGTGPNRFGRSPKGVGLAGLGAIESITFVRAEDRADGRRESTP